jgi:5-methylcytosine-specific restriction endonuclease McrA
MKTCNTCGVTKRLTEFPKNGRFKDGTTRYRADCKECYNIKRKLSKKKLEKFLNNTKHRTGEEDSYTFDDWKETVLYFRGECAYCGRKQSRNIRLTKEHVVPVSKGGVTDKSNIIPACKRCNSAKSDEDLADWYPRQKFYDEGRKERIDRWLNKNA